MEQEKKKSCEVKIEAKQRFLKYCKLGTEILQDKEGEKNTREKDHYEKKLYV